MDREQPEKSGKTSLTTTSGGADMAALPPTPLPESSTRPSLLKPEQYIMSGNTLVDEETTQIPTSGLPSLTSALSMDFDAGKSFMPRDDGGTTNFIPRSTLHAPSPTRVTSWACSSNTSSPLQSAYASSASLQSFPAGGSSVGDIDEPTPVAVVHVPSTSTQFYHRASEAPTATSLPPIVSTSRQPIAQVRREGPHYPNQSFAALQSQYYPPPYQPHPLRTRSSHPSQNTSYTSASSPQSRDRSSFVTGAKTVGNTPAQSPGLFSPAISSHKMAGGNMEDGQYVTPLLHPTHLQAPKE